MAEERISIHHCSNKCRYLREIKGDCDMVKEECMGYPAPKRLSVWQRRCAKKFTEILGVQPQKYSKLIL